MALKIGALFTPVARSVTNTATKLGAGTAGAPNSGRQSLLLHNKGAQTVFLGNGSVTAANGIPLDPAEKITLEVTAQCDVYGIVASGSCEVRVLEGK